MEISAALWDLRLGKDFTSCLISRLEKKQKAGEDDDVRVASNESLVHESIET